MNKLLIVASLTICFSCNNGNNESKNQIEQNSTSVVEQSSKEYKDIDYLPADLFAHINIQSPFEKIKEIFGTADKIIPSDINQYTGYLYFLKNGMLYIHTKDDKTISSICVQSNNKEPYVRIGNFCAMYPMDNVLDLGKSTMDKLNIQEGEKVEVSRERVYKLIIYPSGGMRTCDYISSIFGSVQEYGKEIEVEQSYEGSTFFELSDGFAINAKLNQLLIDYVIIGDPEVIKQCHTYGEGVHSDLTK